MYHLRVHVNGPQPVIDAIVRELTAAGARPADRAQPSCLVLTCGDGLESWEALSRRHPDATLGLERFEEFEDELLRAVVASGRVTVMARHGVLPDGWGGFHDEDGVPLDAGLLRKAAESVAARRARQDVGILTGAVEVALTMGKALGRLCSRIEPTVLEDPAPDALDAVIELAVLALAIGSPGGSGSPAALEFEHALRLTRSVVHAGRSELEERPGEACWSDWAVTLISSTGGVIDAACDYAFARDAGSHALHAEHDGTAMEQLDFAARSLLTTCLQALALFNGAQP